jgi:hypothetical protein
LIFCAAKQNNSPRRKSFEEYVEKFILHRAMQVNANSYFRRKLRTKLRSAIIFAPLLLAAACAGCVAAPSLAPLYTKPVIVNSDDLVGRWDMVDQTDGKQKSECCLTITKSDDGYDSQIPDDEEKQILDTTFHLVKLGDALFIDAEGASLQYSTTTKVSTPMLQVHAIGRIWIEKDSVRVELLDDDWLKSTAKSGAPALSFVEPDKQLVVTATTEQLQAFALKYANDTKAFSSELKLTRHK